MSTDQTVVVLGCCACFLVCCKQAWEVVGEQYIFFFYGKELLRLVLDWLMWNYEALQRPKSVRTIAVTSTFWQNKFSQVMALVVPEPASSLSADDTRHHSLLIALLQPAQHFARKLRPCCLKFYRSLWIEFGGENKMYGKVIFAAQNPLEFWSIWSPKLSCDR